MQETPQLENGYLRIANELYDAILRHPFSKRELLIVLAIIRKTYGYGKKRDDISLSQLSHLTGLNQAHISRSINDLVSAGVLLKQQGQYAQTLEVIKHYSTWKVLPKQQPHYQNSNTSLADSAIDPLPKQQPQKTTNKRQLTKDKGQFVLHESIDSQIWEDFEAHRKEIKKTLNNRGRELNQKVLIGKPKSEQRQIVDNAIRSRWSGLFPLKANTSKLPNVDLNDEKSMGRLGKQLGVLPRPGESHFDYNRRVLEANRGV